LVDFVREIIELFHAERETHTLDGAEDIAGNRHVESGRLLEQQRRPAVRRFARTIRHRRDFESRAQRVAHACEQLALVEVLQKFREIRIHRQNVGHEDTKLTKTHEELRLYKISSCTFVTSWL